MNKLLLTIICCLAPYMLLAQTVTDTANMDIDTTGQRDLIDIGRKLFKIKPRRKPGKKEVYFSILPLSTSVPGGSKAIVTSTTAGFYLGNRKTTYLSTVTFAPYLNFKGRYGLPVHSSVWTPDNTYNIQGDIRFLVYPQNTWGLGGKNSEDERLLVNFDYIRFYQTVLKRIQPFFYVGVGYNMDYYFNINTNVNGQTTSLKDFTQYPYGTTAGENSFSSGLTLNAVYDTRQNLFNPFPGIFANVIYRHNAGFLGSDNNSQSLYLDFRKYIAVGDNSVYKSVFAFWTYYWTTISKGTPYLNLPGIGNDPYQRSGRGIEQNRYRGNSLIYFEAEYRRDITANGLFGFVLFANFNSASELNTRHFTYVNPAAGGGLRVKFNKRSATNIAIDYGFSKGYNGLIVGLGEAF
ncbi:BamA/TamA family outer membrane protein [Mucilaginibacter sp. L3T2-6]|uniref:BamA/TamA family outer membrane protein n=1 Tax=Mucilaginibacter sp. L3T2-6 TaxID=3062491 RepID=UPI0026759F96|nr:BamA/TamA family outer membrane protein [Mucilaginibacter sp. L3T2-6]MDO3644802.1 BamA/TamA family outer membrane protein [Mucilaginibacter sp. L3T2-6]MDV6217304.1 BamA/TamA family outer membrane protein [Mucilaginibacter sp. L3T2-6]